MEARGTLTPESLHDVFQKLAKNKAIGTLIVSQGENRKYVYFARAGVRLLSSGKQRRMRLGDILVQQGKISTDQLKAILQRQEETGEMIGKILTDWGLVTEEDIDEAVKGQIEEDIYDLFTWEEATYEFTEGAPPPELFDPDQRATRLTFDVHRLVSEAGNRAAELRELRRVIPTERAVFAPSPGAPKEIADRDATAAVRAVAGLVDGRRTAGEIAEAAQISRFDAFRALAALALAGRIRGSDGGGRGGPAGAPRADGKGAVSKMESRLLAAPDDHELRRKLAAAYEEAGERGKAALHWNLAAKSLQKEGQLEEGLDATRHALEITPDDLEAAERMLRLTVELRRPEEAMDQAEALASRYSDAGDHEKLRNMYALLLHIVPEDLEVRKKLVNVHLDLEDMDAALEEYVEMAKVLAKRKDQKTLEEVYGKVLRLAPNRTDVQRRLRSLGIGGEIVRARRPSRWRRKLGIVFLLLALLGLAAGGVFLESRARADASIPWEAALVAERVAAEAKDPQNALKRAQEALAALEGIERRHPFSLFTLLEVAPKVAAAKARISELQGLVADRDRVVRQRYTDRQLEAKQLESDSRTDEAMAIWKELDQMPPADRALVKEIHKDAHERVEKVRRKSAEGDDLWAKARAQAQAGQLADARETVKKLRSDEFRNTSAQAASQWPVRLETRPPEAEARRAGQLLGKTPYLFWLLREEERDGVPLEFEISRTGYERQEIRFVASDAKDGVLSIPLTKRPLFVIPAGGAVESGPVVADGWLAVGSRNGKGEVLGVRLADVHPEDPATWRPSWQYDVQGDIDTAVIGPVLEDGGSLYAATRSGLLLALAMRPEAPGGGVIARGELLWSFPPGNGRIGTVYGGPVASDDAIAVCGYSGTQGVLVLLARGSRGGGARPLRREEVGPSESSPLVTGPLIVVADRAGGVQVYHRLRELVIARGQLPVRVRASGRPAADGDALAVGGKDGKLYLLDFADAEGEKGPSLVLRDEADLGEAIAPSPVAREGTFYAASRKGLVAAFRVKPGGRFEERWRKDVRHPVTVGPVLSQNALYVGTEKGTLVRVNAFTGEIEWEFEVPRDPKRPGPVAINSRPAVANGVVYFGCDDGNVYALAER